jgi:hypothetical protein
MVSFLGKMAAGADIRGCGRQFIPSLLHFVSFFYLILQLSTLGLGYGYRGNLESGRVDWRFLFFRFRMVSGSDRPDCMFIHFILRVANAGPDPAFAFAIHRHCHCHCHFPDIYLLLLYLFYIT